MALLIRIEGPTTAWGLVEHFKDKPLGSVLTVPVRHVLVRILSDLSRMHIM